MRLFAQVAWMVPWIVPWVAVGFVIAYLLGAPFQAEMAENDPRRLYIGLGALAVGMAVAFVGSVVTLRRIHKNDPPEPDGDDSQAG
jgi:hypothetical protein